MRVRFSVPLNTYLAMPEESTRQAQAHCVNCGFEAPRGSDTWIQLDHPPLGTVTECPECGSTQIHSDR